MDRYVADAYVRSLEVEDALVAVSRRVRRDSVIAALSSTVQDVRLFAIRLMEAKEMMPTSLAREVIERDRSPKVRIAAVRSLLAIDEPVDLSLLERATEKRDDDLTHFGGFDDTRVLRAEVAMQLPKEELRAGVRWDSIYGSECYEALGMRDEQWAEKNVRSDLRNDFARLKAAGLQAMVARSISRMEAEAGRALSEGEQQLAIEGANRYWREFTDEEKLGPFLTRQFQRAALRVLVARGRASDVRLARAFATSDDQDLRAEALRLFERFGTSHDAATVRTLADQVYDDDLRERAAVLAFRLAFKKDKLGLLRTLRENRALRAWAVGRLADVEGGFDEALQLLWDSEADVRIPATAVVMDAVGRERGDKLLSAYMSGHHFYNVVRAIDQWLYAPEWLRGVLGE